MRPYGEEFCDPRLNIRGLSSYDRRRYGPSDAGTWHMQRALQERRDSRVLKRLQRKRARAAAKLGLRTFCHL
jgi:hypothetical protein